MTLNLRSGDIIIFFRGIWHSDNFVTLFLKQVCWSSVARRAIRFKLMRAIYFPAGLGYVVTVV